MRIALIATCLGDALFPEVGKATTRLLERLGHEVVFPPDQVCCVVSDSCRAPMPTRWRS